MNENESTIITNEVINPVTELPTDIGEQAASRALAPDGSVPQVVLSQITASLPKQERVVAEVHPAASLVAELHDGLVKFENLPADALAWIKSKIDEIRAAL